MSRTRDTADLVTLNALNAEGGRVGIGTTAKSNQLTVEGNTNITGITTASQLHSSGVIKGASVALNDASKFNVNATGNLAAQAVTANNGLNIFGDSLLVEGGTTFFGNSTTALDTRHYGDYEFRDSSNNINLKLYQSGDLDVGRNLVVTGVSTFTGIVTTSGDLFVSGNLTVSGTTQKESLSVVNAEVTGVATVKTNNVTNSNITNLVVTGVSTLGVVTSVTSIQATKFYGDGAGLTNVGVDTANVSTNTLFVVGVSTLTGIVTTTGDLYVGGVLYAGDVEKSDLVVSGIATIGTLEVGGPVQSVGVSTNYSQVTITGQSPSSLNETYQRAATGFTLDTGTIASGNALFNTDSNYYYYVASTGFDAVDKIIIFSVEDNSWFTIYNFNDPDYSEGNITNNQALGSSGIFSDSLTATTIADGGRNIPQASSDIVYVTSGGGTTGGIGVTIRTDGDGIFAGVVTATSFVGNGSNLTSIVTSLTAGDNISLNGSTGDLTITGLANTTNVSTNTLVVSGITTTATLLVGGDIQLPSSTNYAEVTLSGLSPSSFNETYARQSTGFVLDTGTVASGNAQFHADSNYYYYVATTGSSPDSRMLIYSVVDNSWMAVFNFNGTNYTEGNVSNDQAVGSSGIFNATVTATSITADGRNVPQASGSIVYSTTGGGTTTSIGATITTPGNAIFAGVVTATSFVGDGSGLTGMANTANVSTNTLNVVGVGTYGNNVIINAPGRLGVRTDSPNATVEVNGQVRINNQAGSGFEFLPDVAANGVQRILSYNRGTSEYNILSIGSSQTRFTTGTDNPANVVLTLLPNKNVGIGSTQPTSKLTVEGGALVSGATTFSNNVTISGDLVVSGTTQKSSLAVVNAEVTGIATIASNEVTNSTVTNLNVAGVTTATGLDINGNADISGNLKVDGVLTYDDVTNIDSVGVITARKGVNITSGGLAVVGVTTLQQTNLTNNVTVPNNITFAVKDNSALAFRIMEDTNEYLRVDTTDGSEAFRFKKELDTDALLSVGAGVTLANQTDIQMADNSGFAFRIREGSNEYVRFRTTDGTEEIDFTKSVKLDGGGTIAGPITYSGEIDCTLDAGTSNALDFVIDGGNRLMRFNTSQEKVHLEQGFEVDGTSQFDGIPTFNANMVISGSRDLTLDASTSNALDIVIDGGNRLVRFNTNLQKVHLEQNFEVDGDSTLAAVSVTSLNSTGNIGINTTIPTITSGSGMEIVGSTAGMRLRLTGAGNWAFVEFADENDTVKFMTGYRTSSGLYGIRPGASLNSTTGVAVDSVGNVGINITPTSRLHVNGNALIVGVVTAASLQGNAQSIQAGTIGVLGNSNDTSTSFPAIVARNFENAGTNYQGRRADGTITYSVSALGAVTATSFSGDGSGLTNVGAASTANVSTNTLNVVGVSTFGGNVSNSSFDNTSDNANAHGFRLENDNSSNISQFDFQVSTGRPDDYEAFHLYKGSSKNITFFADGNATFAGAVTAASFSGDGSALTGITGVSTANVSTNTLNVVGVSTFNDAVTIDSVAISAVQTSSESFVDSDTTLMTAAATDDRFNALGGITETTGTTTGTFRGSTGEPGTLVTTTLNYVKIGKLVITTFNTGAQSFVGYTGTFSLEGFFYAAATGIDFTGSFVSSGSVFESSNNDGMNSHLSGGSTTLELRAQDGNNASVTWSASGTDVLQGTIMYYTN